MKEVHFCNAAVSVTANQTFAFRVFPRLSFRFGERRKFSQRKTNTRTVLTCGDLGEGRGQKAGAVGRGVAGRLGRRLPRGAEHGSEVVGAGGDFLREVFMDS